MWLLPALSPIARLVSYVFYRLAITGPRPPRTGPLLIVANHANGLLDPALVAAAARRPLRFLAKAPLFDDRRVGWLVRGVGSISVYRKIDDPGQTASNREMFDAACDALGQGAAIALFPEGTSHSDPSLKPLRTGAARIALQAAAGIGATFPVAPVGLVFRDKERFRSHALVVRGEPVEWSDLAGAGVENEAAVRELTRRLDSAIREVTINLERWEDAPLLACAEAIWDAEVDATVAAGRAGPSSVDRAEQARRLDTAARLLSTWRRRLDPEDPELVADLLRHDRRLRWLGLTPRALVTEVDADRAWRWAASRLLFLGPVVLAVAVVGHLVFFVPYLVVGRIADAVTPSDDQTATYKLLIGIVCYALWVFALGGLAAAVASALDEPPLRAVAWGLGTMAVAPAIGLAGLAIRERWRSSARDLRRFVVLRSRRSWIESRRREQEQLAIRLRRVVEG